MVSMNKPDDILVDGKKIVDVLQACGANKRHPLKLYFCNRQVCGKCDQSCAYTTTRTGSVDGKYEMSAYKNKRKIIFDVEEMKCDSVEMTKNTN